MPITTAFFSWQTDRPTKGGRNLLDRALEDAAGRLSVDLTIEEVVRGFAIDRDTKGVPGSPPIVDTIFRKIDAAAVFVPDLTFVATRPDGRPTPNPNVLIEYGWALKSLGHARIVPVMNTAFGEATPNTMPFDMRHLRYPISYHCPEGASAEDRKAAREALSKSLEKAIRDVLDSESFRASLQAAPVPEPFHRVDALDGPGRFRVRTEALGFAEAPFGAADGRGIVLSPQPVVWFRLMPDRDPGRKWLVTELKKVATQGDAHLRPASDAWHSLNYLRSSDGFGVYAVTADDPLSTQAAVFAFVTGEI